MNLIPITKKEVISLLTQDDYYRRQRKWPLISYKEIQDFCHRNISGELFSITTYAIKRSPSLTQSLTSIERVIEEINSLHPFTNELLIKFSNNLVACGGAICKSVLNHESTHREMTDDIDFFFYDSDVYRANQMRIEIIEYMINIWKSHIGKDVIRYNNYNGCVQVVLRDVKFYIQRNEHVTTLHVEELCDEYPKVYMYQFIHRIYPDVSSIIGGFDLSSSAIAYNGKEIYTTPLGAWSFINKSIIIDMGRRSTSYEHRLKKYNRYGFRLIFPGLTEEIIRNELREIYDDKKTFYKFKSEIEKLANDNGYFLNIGINLTKVFSRIDGENEDTDEYDELAFHEIQKEKDVLQCLILNIDDGNDNEIHIKHSSGDQYDWWNHETYEHGGKCVDRDYYLNKLSDYGADEKYLTSISDYSHNHMYYKHVPSANVTRLTLNNLNGVVSMLYIDNHENIKDKLINEINNPNLGINDFVIDLYKNKVDKEISKLKYSLNNGWHTQQPSLIKCFGPFTSEILNYEDYAEARDLMIENIKKNNEICKSNLIGIKWITENPGRQWTSSINPIFEDPRDWYGKHYIPVLVGIPPEIETCIRLMRLEKTQSVWVMLPKDIFDLILLYILRAYANGAWKHIK